MTGTTLELTYLLAEVPSADPERAEEDGKLAEAELVRSFVEEFDAQELT